MSKNQPLVSQSNIVKDQLAAFGSNLKNHRIQYGWTLDDLAKKSGLSKPFLSRLESGDRQASIAAVLTLSQVFGLSLAEMFETQVALDPCLIVREAESVPREASGLTYVALSQAMRLFNLKPMKVKVSLEREGNEHYRHEGEEWIYVLSGKITLSLAGKTYDIGAGDAIHFDSRLPHRVMARGKVEPEIILVASPLSPERRAAGAAFSLADAKRSIPISEQTKELWAPS